MFIATYVCGCLLVSTLRLRWALLGDGVGGVTARAASASLRHDERSARQTAITWFATSSGFHIGDARSFA